MRDARCVGNLEVWENIGSGSMRGFLWGGFGNRALEVHERRPRSGDPDNGVKLGRLTVTDCIRFSSISSI